MAGFPNDPSIVAGAPSGVAHHPSWPKIVMERQGDLLLVTPDIACLTTVMVNCYLLGRADAGKWVLVDAGLGQGAAARIMRAAEERFGYGRRPGCIILTHGHFDHVGGVVELARRWEVPVYAQEMEMPYLTGNSDYPPPDPTVGGGLMARLSGYYPRDPVDLREHIEYLPADGSVPALPDWRWIHTPGHTPGHISLFRQDDGATIVGDAFVTTNQQSAISVLTQHQRVHGPPTYFTQDWNAARSSVRKLAALRPSIAATGHGIPMYGDRLDHELQELARNFDSLAIPRHGRYVKEPAVFDREGVAYVPAKPLNYVPALAAAAAVAAGVFLGRKFAHRQEQRLSSRNQRHSG